MRMKMSEAKRLWNWSIIVMTLLVGFFMFLVPERALAANIIASGNCGKTNSDCTEAEDNATMTLYDDGLLVISGEGDIYEGTISMVLNAEQRMMVKRCRIESGITRILGYFFTQMNSLETVEISDTVTSLGEGTFNNCVALKTVNIPEGITSIGDMTFCCCSSLETLDIPESVNYIGMGAFAGCSSLRYIILSGNIEEIDSDAFSGCKSLTIEYLGTKKQWNSVKKGEYGRFPSYITLICHGVDITESYSYTPGQVFAILGERAEYTVKAASYAGGLTYTWYYKDPGSEEFLKASEESATFGFTMTEAENGRQVYCVVTDAEGNSATSRTVTMSVPKELTIIEQPVDITGVMNSKQYFSLTADGDGQLKYQWYYQDENDSKAHASTAESKPSYAVTFMASRNNRKIYCIVSDSAGQSVKSDVVQVHIDPLITMQPKSVVAPVGTLAKFTIAAQGEGLTYRWYYMNERVRVWTQSTQTGTTYTTKVTTARNKRQIYCLVTNAAGETSKSDVVTIRVGTPITITKQPTDQTVKEGEVAKFSVEASGDGLKYTWCYKSVGSRYFYYSSQIGSSVYKTTATAERDGRKFYCIITDSKGIQYTTDVVTLHVVPNETEAITITRQPADQTVKEGETAEFAVEASGEGLSYAWYYKSVGRSNYTKSTQTGSVYSTKATAERDGRQIYCVITDPLGQKCTTDVVTLHVEPEETEPETETQPETEPVISEEPTSASEDK